MVHTDTGPTEALSTSQARTSIHASYSNPAAHEIATSSFARSVDTARLETPAKPPVVSLPRPCVSRLGVTGTCDQFKYSSHGNEKRTSGELAAAPSHSASGSEKRSAEPDLEDAPCKRIKTTFSFAVQDNSSPFRQPVCEGYRKSRAECDHKSRCLECDIQISPCKYSRTLLASKLASDHRHRCLGVYVLCDELDNCQNPFCNYLHDQQWDSQHEPMWLIKGVNAFPDGPEHDVDNNLTAIEQLQAVKCESYKTDEVVEMDDSPALKHEAGDFESVSKEDRTATVPTKMETWSTL